MEQRQEGEDEDEEKRFARKLLVADRISEKSYMRVFSGNDSRRLEREFRLERDAFAVAVAMDVSSR